ncbi:hypothetical protein [Neptuniibacter sp.]|uniref:hypothetical protein n=1 Tax=Neptuniibacter sp. TaxID=1962643 RepID=UPI00261BAA60|nr:hypothetical protein [Neptuniibacter sp.]MCP4597035.1 hypothetical protein [Neptuniibacter sp.]
MPLSGFDKKIEGLKQIVKVIETYAPVNDRGERVAVYQRALDAATDTIKKAGRWTAK